MTDELNDNQTRPARRFQSLRCPHCQAESRDHIWDADRESFVCLSCQWRFYGNGADWDQDHE